MMHQPKVLIVAMAGLVASMTQPSVLGAENDSAIEEKIDQLFTGIVSAETPGCAVGVAHEGQLVFAKGYGLANLEHRIPITAQTGFRIASVSKHFTAMAILLLEEQGAVSLGDDIRKYFPELPEYASVVTIGDLVYHSSGLPDNGDLGLEWEAAPDYFLSWAEKDDFFEEGLNYHFVPRREYLKRIAAIKSLKFEPGSRYQYNNAGYVLLSALIERVSGHTLRAFADEFMFRPLAMNATFFNDRALAVVPNRADGYHRTPDGSYIKYMSDLNLVGDGGVFTTIEDYFLWDQNFMKISLERAGPR